VVLPKTKWTLTSSRVSGLNVKIKAGIQRVQDLNAEYQDEAKRVSDEWNAKSLAWAGQGKPHLGSGLYKTTYKVTRSGNDRFTIRVGWIDPKPPAAVGGGGVPYYRFWDSGFNMFGNAARPVVGVGAYLDARDDLRTSITAINQRFATEFARSFKL